MTEPSHADLVETLEEIQDDMEVALKVLDLLLDNDVNDLQAAICLVRMYRAEMYRVTDELDTSLRKLKRLAA
uniref:Uncharacterized protein n=2 Tax=Desertifilum tharense IPPAS B-1220 TaxID=1781255 RepID=A0A1E5QRJ1_9CYAN|nr:hypothetical protein BH720_00220 [Desertifilum tharense IPPAS B-1220]